MTEPVSFDALIKEINIKSLVSGDKAARLTLEFAPTDDVLDGINRLHRADMPVSIGIVLAENNSHAISQRPKRKPKG